MTARRHGAPPRAVRWISLIAVVVALGGCASKPRLSASDFRLEANRICVFGAAQHAALSERYRDDVDTFEDKARALQAKLLDQLKALSPPESLDEAYSRMLDDIEEIASSDPDGAQQAFERFQADAAELGLDECVEPATSSASPTPANV